jgi:predicted membrane protein
MRRFGFGFVVGLFILFIGTSLAIDIMFSIRLPILRGAIALLLVIVGLRMILRGGRLEGAAPESGEAWLADRRFAPEGQLPGDARYDVVFGRGVIDLTHLAEPSTDVTVTVDAVFGTAVVTVDPAIAYDVSASAAFGEVRMPDRSAAAFGSVQYRSPADHRPRLHLKVNAAFGACHVLEGPHVGQVPTTA